jgi:CheY-like chemotaxis protein
VLATTPDWGSLATELGGELTATSAPDERSTFVLRVPASSAPAAGIVRPAAQVPTRRYRILLVDDEQPIRRAVSAVLADAGFAVDDAASGALALERLRADPAVDLILLDRSMPTSPGETFLPALRDLAPAAKIVLFTGQRVEPELRARVDGVLAKPATVDDLCDAINGLLGVPVGA